MTKLSPSAQELLEREQRLRNEILGQPGSPALAREVLGVPTRIPIREPEPMLIPQTSDGQPGILSIDLENSTVFTTLGDFTLDEIEVAQIAYVAMSAVGRSLQETLNKLNEKHGVNDWLEAQRQAAENLRKQQLEAERTRQSDAPKALPQTEMFEEEEEEEAVATTAPHRRRRRREKVN